MELIGAILLWLLGLLLCYAIIYWAVKHAIDDSRLLKEIRDQLAAASNRRSKADNGATQNNEQNPDATESCPACGHAVTEQTKICPSCGLALQ